MKFGRPLAIIVHYAVQFNLECFKALGLTWTLILFCKLFKKIKTRLKSEIKKKSNKRSI